MRPDVHTHSVRLGPLKKTKEYVGFEILNRNFRDLIHLKTQQTTTPRFNNHKFTFTSETKQATNHQDS